MITVAAIIPVALVAGSLIGVLLNARLASRRRQRNCGRLNLTNLYSRLFKRYASFEYEANLLRN
jgi:hypothetical protein